MSSFARGMARLIDGALDRSLIGFSRIGFELRQHLATWPADPAADALQGKHIAVTGASSGLGEQIALDALQLGAHVHLIVRDRERGAKAASRIEQQAARPGGTTVWQCDVSDLESVDSFTADFLAAGVQLAGLVHNAGSMPPERTESAQGHELTMALHVLGPVRMTDGLRPALAHDARVVLVTSGGMYAQRLRADDPDFSDGDYRPTAAYARSKRAQVELLPVLQAQWPMVRVYAMHPGWATTPGLTASLPAFARLTKPILRSAAAGADTAVWLLATEPPPAAGFWHDRALRPTSLVPWTKPSGEQQQRLWEWVRQAALTPRPR